jgi:hypothetical protein
VSDTLCSGGEPQQQPHVVTRSLGESIQLVMSTELNKSVSESPTRFEG